MNGDPQDAFRRAKRSRLLKKSREAAHLAFLAALAEGRFDVTGRWDTRAMRQVT